MVRLIFTAASSLIFVIFCCCFVANKYSVPVKVGFPPGTVSTPVHVCIHAYEIYILHLSTFVSDHTRSRATCFFLAFMHVRTYLQT
jgi:hypothetical protein